VTFYLIFQYSILFGLIVLLAITAYAVKNERKFFDKNKKTIFFFDVTFDIPSWWSKHHISSNKLIFQRRDQKYDWFAFIEKSSLSLSNPIHSHLIILEDQLNVLLKDKLEELNIIFDEKTSPLARKNGLFIEGTGTEKGERRIYLELMVLLHPHTQEIYFLGSLSSVLNGIIEGPYFDLILQNINFIDHQ
jgi:hypothetical protein